VEIAFAIERKYLLSKSKTTDFQRMATLARDGGNESDEFRRLELKYKQSSVVDFGDEIIRISRVAEKLRNLIGANSTMCAILWLAKLSYIVS